MAHNYLPEVFNTVKGIVGYDNGNVFDRNFLFPRRAEKRLEAQKDILLQVMEDKKEVLLAEIAAQKEISIAQHQLQYDLEKLKHETFCTVILDLKEWPLGNSVDGVAAISSMVTQIGEIISKS